MKKRLLTLCLISIAAMPAESQAPSSIHLPAPETDGVVSLEQTLEERRSVRDFSAEPLSLAAVSQILWAAQGITARDGGRTAPSAGALYPLELYLVAGNAEAIPAGVYRYYPRRHELRLHADGDLRAPLAAAALRQEAIADGAAVLVIAAVYERTARRYGSRATRYVHMEAGHVAQNVYLQAQSLGLGTVIIGAFEDDRVSTALGLPSDEAPLALMPLGTPR